MQVFNNLLITFSLYVGSNPTLSATRDINSRGPGSVSSGSHEAGITPARAAPQGRGAQRRVIPPSPPIMTSIPFALDQRTATATQRG